MSSGGRRTDNTFLGYTIVLGALVLLVVLMTVVVNARREERIPTVDYTPDVLSLSEVAPYQVYAPDQELLPEGWTPTSSRLEDGGVLPGEEPTEPVRWSVGFATPEDRHAAFHISNADPEAFVAEVSMDGEPDGESTVDGRVWERRYNETEDERSLVLRADDATLVVSGGASYEELETLAGALQPQAAPQE
ncbi:DUF4245 domain-containing protein [Thermobifida cellulosilytica]|uniref:DUF4245 domain-containing protein n=1 Tax=Thermobifida cellulosilytica TB100 TaxID=665004 RepID=A0A147KF41_THECS|nr:DUF4245 domain-containing protein [Thermobifida cellulosilytica]KUP95880.1 hypothetical protein AC529_14945 [Thermobifida cellulosilytica TB100]